MALEEANYSPTRMLVIFWMADLADDRLRFVCCALSTSVEMDVWASYLGDFFRFHSLGTAGVSASED